MFELTPFNRKHHHDFVNPFQNFEEFEKNFFSSSFLAEFKTDIQDRGDVYVMEADLPGFQKDEIHVDIDGSYLTIEAQRRTESEEKDKRGNYIKRERSYGSFRRSFDVSAVKTEEITAEYKDGVLKLTMPKKEGADSASRRLEIQ